MEERWLPLLYLLGALVGYGLFMRTQPLRAAFASGFRFTRNNFTIVLTIAILLVAHVIWRFTQQTGLSSGDQLALEVSQLSDLTSWIPFVAEDLRSVFWYVIPLDIAFIVGTPIAFLSTWFWIPRLWHAFAPGKRWIAGMVFGLFGLSLWWWSHRLSVFMRWDTNPVPDWVGLHQILYGSSEIAFAVMVACFIQFVLVLGAYRSHGTGTGKCRLVEAFNFGFKCFSRLLPIALICLAGITMNWFATDRLDLQSGPVWDGLKLVAMLSLGTVPIALLLLQEGHWGDSIKSGLRFLARTSWRYLWFVFIALVHFLLLRVLESYLLTSALTTETGIIIWHVTSAILKSWLVIWLVNALCLYFCIDVSQRQRTKKKKPMQLAALQARTRSKRRLSIRR